MKVLFLFFSIANIFVFHCQYCTIDFAQTEIGIHPSNLPSATVGQPYNQDITFVFPLDTLGYNFTNFQIVSINLPPGLDWQCNNEANNCNYNPQNTPKGCIQIYGIPLVAGSYTMDAFLLADLSIVSGYPINFQISFEVLAIEIPNSSSNYTVTGAPACAPTIVNFNNLHPGLEYYYWNFGNGNISYVEQPPSQYFELSGIYWIEYAAYESIDTNYLITFTGLNIDELGNFGGGFPSFELADAYFKILENGQPYYQSNIVLNQNPPIQWLVNVILNPNQNYTIEIWEADQSCGELFLGDDDYIGSIQLNINGCSSCSIGNSVVNYTVQNQIIEPSPLFYSLDSIEIYPLPNTPVLTYNDIDQELCSAELELENQWYLNNTIIQDSDSNCLQIDQNGSYQLVVYNIYGCMAESDTFWIELPLNGLLINTLETPLIFPNPTAGDLQLEFNDSWLKSTFKVCDFMGKVILQQEINKPKSSIDLSMIADGFYQIILENQKGYFHQIILKNSSCSD